jgi:hypothetical protein
MQMEKVWKSWKKASLEDYTSIVYAKHGGKMAKLN